MGRIVRRSPSAWLDAGQSELIWLTTINDRRLEPEKLARPAGLRRRYGAMTEGDPTKAAKLVEAKAREQLDLLRAKKDAVLNQARKAAADLERKIVENAPYPNND